MQLPLFIARRYLFGKKSHNIINIISIISLIGVTTGVMALVIVLSVFNGFDSLIAGLYTAIDSEVKIVPEQGKTFTIATSEFEQIRKLPNVAVFSEVVEENALFRFRRKQHIGTVKGVSRNYHTLTGLDTLMKEGSFRLWRGSQPLAVMGQGVAYFLSASLAQFDPLYIYLPRRGRIGLSLESAFGKKAIMPSGIFAVEQEFDSRYVFIPIKVIRKLLRYDSTRVTSVELKLKDASRDRETIGQIKSILGNGYKVLNRYQQNESLYRTMKTEKFAIALILILILVVASFNIIGSLSMLIIDKQKDVATLRSMGADNSLIRKIFLFEGLLISAGGTILGTVLGLVVCWAQITFKLIKLQGRGNFIIDAYPVDIRLSDIGLIVGTVMLIGYLAARFPVRIIAKRILTQGSITNPIRN